MISLNVMLLHGSGFKTELPLIKSRTALCRGAVPSQWQMEAYMCFCKGALEVILEECQEIRPHGRYLFDVNCVL